MGLGSLAVGAEPSTTLFSGYTVLCTPRDGWIDGGRHGLFHRDCRVLSRHLLRVADSTPELVGAVQPESDRWVAVLRVPRPGGDAEGPQLPQDALEVQVERSVGPGLLEAIRVRNRSAVPCRTTLRLDLDADFADTAELNRKRKQHGTTDAEVDEAGQRLMLHYRVSENGRTDERGLRVAVREATTPVAIDESGLSVELDLPGSASWAATLHYAVLDSGDWRGPPAPGERDNRTLQRATWRRRRPAVECAEPLRGTFERAADDLFDLRNWELEDRYLGRTDGAAWILNAGVPMFTGLFGRDAITAGWQSSILGPRATAGALAAIGRLQATTDDPWRDAEPGKLIHEQRFGPLAMLGLSPRDAYYGTQTTPALFVLALSELWHWTGDDGVLRRHLDVARRAMDWARTDGDLDGDGLLEYRRRSEGGLRNQAWKDSDEAIRWPDGSIVDGPVATVEEQAFSILAWERFAEILVALGDDAGADDAAAMARRMRRRWHEAFWMPDEQFYAMALDGRKTQVPTIGSNAGHALGAGIVPAEHARAVADRLMAPDLFSGWGVRSLSDRDRSYNPFAYHLGTVWPVEQATFALGFKRYGLDEHLDRLAGAVFDAAFASPDGRLPEVLTGHARDEVAAPIPYPAANVPQAWSASALVQLVQILLGLYPFAPLRTLAVVRPRLPASIPTLTVRRLRVGSASVDLRFDRREDGSASWRVLRQRGPLLLVPAGPPNGLGTPSWLDRLELGALDRAPGRLARAARLALGRLD